MTKKKQMPEKFRELAEYNSRKEKGIMHIIDYVIRMMKLQKEFNEWLKSNQNAVGGGLNEI